MNKYHVNSGKYGIYAGIFKNEEDRSRQAKEENVDEWLETSNVTIEALASVAKYLLTNNLIFHCSYKGKAYVLHVDPRSESDPTRPKNTDEAADMIEDVIDMLIEVGNGVTDEMLHEGADELMKARDILFPDHWHKE